MRIYFTLILPLFLASVNQLTAQHIAVPLPVEDSIATSEQAMKPYDEQLEYSTVRIRMLPIKGGEFVMGSPKTEAKRTVDEGPQHNVKIDPFWMAETETTWDAFEVWADNLDILFRQRHDVMPTPRDKVAEQYQLSQPTTPYLLMDFGMGKHGYPAISMTQLAARTFCEWLSAKTGRYYRLPTEAEWEYACRAGTTTAYSWGNNPAKSDEFAWSFENTSETYQKVRLKKPNPWGLYDMHGNVSEWVLDQYDATSYEDAKNAQVILNPLRIPTTIYPRVVRGGSYYDDIDRLRSAARHKSDPSWKRSDPGIPKSIWWHADAPYFGFRVVRPLEVPAQKEIDEKWGRHAPFQDPQRATRRRR